VFFALTGVTHGELVRGVRYTPRGAETESIMMRSRSGTVRRIEASHNFQKLTRYASIPYDEP
jgi:fructose-1,6-bisphosphatase II